MYPTSTQPFTACICVQQGLHCIFHGEHTHSTCQNHNLQPWLSWDFLQRRCVWLFVTPGTRVGLSDRKHSLIQVSGVWVIKASLSVSVHHHTGDVQATQQHDDLSAGPFPANLSTYEWKYDLLLTSKCCVSRGMAIRNITLYCTL